MVTIKIGTSVISIKEIKPDWIVQQIENRKKDGISSICTRVIIKESDIDINLSTKTCPKGLGSRLPNNHEREIIKLWENHRLNEDDYSPGNLISFLKKLEHNL